MGEISLDPPTNPFPAISAEIRDLEASRDKMENDGMHHVLTAYRDAKRGAERRIIGAVGRAMRIFDDSAVTSHAFVHVRRESTDRDHHNRSFSFMGTKSAGDDPLSIILRAHTS